MYQERPPGPPLTAVVAAVWQRSAAGPPRRHRVVPDGCTDLIWVEGQLLVAGPDTHAQLTDEAPAANYAAIRFAPGAGPTWFGVPGDELRNCRIPLAALWPAGVVRRLTEAIDASPDRTRAMEAQVAARLHTSGWPDPRYTVIATQQRAGRSVAALADQLGLSTRQLHRRCLAGFGYGPKQLARVLRFQDALAQARAGVPLATVAAACGYADQSHLAREVRSLAGAPLRELLHQSPTTAPGVSGATCPAL